MIGNVLDARLHKRMVSLTKGSERLSVLDFLVVTVACQEQGIIDDTVRAPGRDTADPRTSIGRSSRAAEEHGQERQRGDGKYIGMT